MNSTDLQAVSRALQQRLEAVPSLAWVDHLRLRSIEQDVVRFEPGPGQRSVAQFATERQRARLAEELQQVLGRRVRVEVLTPAGPESAAEAVCDDTQGRVETLSGADRRAVLDLPLVRDILEVFPDATLVDARTSNTSADDSAKTPAEDWQHPEPDA